MRITLEIDDIEIGQTVTILVDGVHYVDVDDPEPEEEPEEIKKQNIRPIASLKQP